MYKSNPFAKKYKSNPFAKKYFQAKSKKYVSIAKKSFKRLEKENEKMYAEDGTLTDEYNDQTMCDYSDMENFLEFIECKDDFYNIDSCIVDLIKLDNEIEKGKELLVQVQEKINQAKIKKENILINSLKVKS